MKALNKKKGGGKSMHSCGFYGMVIFFYWKSFCLVLLWQLHSFVFSSNRSESKEMIKDDQGWPWSLWACIGGKVALHWWQSCFTLVAKSPCIVGLICLSLNNKGESKIQEIALDTGRICCELIRSDPGVFEFALVAQWPYIGGKVALLWWQSSLETAK